jgi:hypothetical protein
VRGYSVGVAERDHDLAFISSIDAPVPCASFIVVAPIGELPPDCQ